MPIGIKNRSNARIKQIRFIQKQPAPPARPTPNAPPTRPTRPARSFLILGVGRARRAGNFSILLHRMRACPQEKETDAQAFSLPKNCSKKISTAGTKCFVGRYNRKPVL